MSEIDKDSIEDSFDGDKILSEYDSMTRDDVIELLGEKYSGELRERIENGNINYDEFTKICDEAFQKYPQRADWVKNMIFRKLSETEVRNMFESYFPDLRERIENGNINFEEFTQMCNDTFPDTPEKANWVRNMIFNRLSKTEGFNMFESDTAKRQAYAKMEDLREKAKNGKLTETELKDLCETAFGKDSKEAKSVYDKMIETGKVKVAETKPKSDEYQKQVAEVNRDNAPEHQRTTVETERSTQPAREQAREDNKFIQELKQQTYTPEEIARNDAKAMESPAIEQPTIQVPVTQGPEMVI